MILRECVLVVYHNVPCVFFLLSKGVACDSLNPCTAVHLHEAHIFSSAFNMCLDQLSTLTADHQGSEYFSRQSAGPVIGRSWVQSPA